MDEKELPKTLNFDYLKSPQFRVVHADGAFIALNGKGNLTLSFFAERQAIPRRVVHLVNSDGSIGEEVADARVVRDAIIRDTEVTVSMEYDVAVRFLDTLKQIVEKRDEVVQRAASRGK